ncbi:hypothetical protein QTH97_14330 [Variovorax sp. J22R24]|uniref:hypothetical protein n=1 Tax=Variovorax gracilis TaxID=3053502 RepID=UPI002575705A|nr:hypothetical protein [Variovorax sp. J22R24]MDM0106118.1 hypothetical protein [Variovorax sp. J22R24]
MQLKNDLQGRQMLDETVLNYYKAHGNRFVKRFLYSEDEEWGWWYSHYLVDRKHVIRYGIGQDRQAWVGGVELGIGAHYFGAAEFWSSEDFWRFGNQATTEEVERNLALLDEFLGYK